MYQVDVVCSVEDRLGESPVWDARDGTLYWVDALRPCIHRLDAHGGLSTWAMPRTLGSIAVRRRGGLVAAGQGGFSFVEPDGGVAGMLRDPEPVGSANILNDGKCDSRGRFWCGSRDPAFSAPTGILHRLDADLSCHAMDQGFIVSNGIAWSPDDRTMYFADSIAQQVFAYDFDADGGAIRGRRPFFSTRELGGGPDGAAVDAEGCYWTALFGAGLVVRIDPRGRLVSRIPLPVTNPTMCTFGGPALDVLFVTSATARLSPQQRAAEPAAGALLAVTGLGVRGFAGALFEG